VSSFSIPTRHCLRPWRPSPLLSPVPHLSPILVYEQKLTTFLRISGVYNHRTQCPTIKMLPRGFL
jgi:hypothetical protein